MFSDPAPKRFRDDFEIRQLSGADFEEFVPGDVMIEMDKPIPITGHNAEEIGLGCG
jgi:hypothetical protein